MSGTGRDHVGSDGPRKPRRRGLMNRILVVIVALMFALASSGPADAQRIKAGTLDCDVSGGWGWIIGSVKRVSCVFTPDRPGPVEYYGGAKRKIGPGYGASGRPAEGWVAVGC